MRASKIKHLRSVNSEDAITWNVFRSLRQVDPAVWLPILWAEAFAPTAPPADLVSTVRLWESVAPPLGLLVDGDEGASEIDVIIESAWSVWFIEAKYRSDISTGTTTGRLATRCFATSMSAHNMPAFVDSHSWYRPTSVRRKAFNAYREYQDLAVVRAKLERHRPDRLANLDAIGQVTWAQLSRVLAHAETNAPREDERLYATTLTWLRDRGHETTLETRNDVSSPAPNYGSISDRPR